MFANTPSKISHQITKLCRLIVANPMPTFVAVVPGCSAVRDECFDNVRRKVAEEGGDIQYGWQLWEWPNIYIEAEFHAVWKPPNNGYLDITPKEKPTDCILFLPDIVRRYEGKRIDNIRRPLRKDRLILDFLSISADIFNMKMRGVHPNNPGKFTMPVEPFKKLNKHYLIRREMLSRGDTENSLCFCGSSKKYKNCHAL